jgi:hypothetical protein
MGMLVEVVMAWRDYMEALVLVRGRKRVKGFLNSVKCWTWKHSFYKKGIRPDNI